MAQDLRDLFKEKDKQSTLHMTEGHEERFLNKLDQAIPIAKPVGWRFQMWQIAASFLLLLGLGYGIYHVFQKPVGDSTESIADTDSHVKEQQLKSLGDISPDLKKVEDYYLAHINLELSKVKLTPDNKELFDGYVIRLGELNQEYKKLSLELTENGPNELTVSALIDNLKLRLNLLYRLKEQLHDLNASEEASKV
ncbi:hypothetical protein ACU8DI_09585 [Psychroserpens sp. BH13MA-6]